MFDHHDLTKQASQQYASKWHTLSQVTHTRCSACWLRSYECYCAHFHQMGQYVEPATISSIIIYFHYQELGRSTNTAHLLPIILPQLCRSIVYGDSPQEVDLVEQIMFELIAGGRKSICILYPTKECPTVTLWLQQQQQQRHKKIHAGCAVKSSVATIEEEVLEGEVSMAAAAGGVTLVVIDGTYSQARRQVNHLDHLLRATAGYQSHFQLPLVKLDFDAIGGACVSSLGKSISTIDGPVEGVIG